MVCPSPSPDCSTDAAASKASAVPTSSARRELLERHFPKSVDEVTLEFVSALLGRPDLSATSVEKVFSDGVTADCAILRLSAPSGDSSVMLKYAKNSAVTRKMAGCLYKKEAFMYSDLHGRVSKALPIPGSVEVFAAQGSSGDDGTAAADPADVIIAMEDLSARYDCMDAVKGISFEDGAHLTDLVAGFHAEFWNDASVLEIPLCASGKAFNLQKLIDEPAILDRWHNLFLTDSRMGEGRNVDLFPTDKYKTMVRLWKKHGPAILTDIEERVLKNRKLTLIHGDMTPSNVMKLRNSCAEADGAEQLSKFRIIDWQTYRSGSPGTELVQLLSIAFTNIEDLDRLPELLERYLVSLHNRCPAARELPYTMDMLIEDYRTSLFIMQIGLSAMMGPILESLPAGHFLWKAVSTLWPRYVRAGEVMDLPGYIIEMCGRLGLPDAEAEAGGSSIQ